MILRSQDGWLRCVNVGADVVTARVCDCCHGIAWLTRWLMAILWLLAELVVVFVCVSACVGCTVGVLGLNVRAVCEA